MKFFKDTTGREWEVKVTVGSIARVQDELGIDLTRIFDDKSPDSRLATDHLLLWRVICCLVKPQLTARDITADELGDALDEAAGEAAGLAVIEAVIDFFQGQKREVMSRAFRRLIEAGKRARETSLAAMTQHLESVDFEKVVSVAAAGRPRAGNSAELPG